MQQSSELFFASSNENKFQEAERILSNLGVQINFFKTTLEEIQSNNLTYQGNPYTKYQRQIKKKISL